MGKCNCGGKTIRFTPGKPKKGTIKKGSISKGSLAANGIKTGKPPKGGKGKGTPSPCKCTQ